jgi:RimJ/RimL family protein N-acetyltransferase
VQHLTDAAYACMPRPRIASGRMSIRAVQPGHVESIRRWRNAQMDVLRQSEAIGEERQRAYYAAHVWPAMAETRPANVLLIYEEDGEPVGYGGLVHIAWEHLRAEISFLLDPALTGDGAAYRRYFSAFLGLIAELGFRDLGLNRLFVETYAMRTAHIAILEEAGFAREGVMREHVMIDGRPCDSLIHARLGKMEGLTKS